MWVHEYTKDIRATPETLWRLLADVDGWVHWNAGIESISLDGPLAVGTRFRMTPPGEQTLTSTIVELEPGRLLTDLTELDGVAVRVEHRLDPGRDATTVTYRIAVSGDGLPDDAAAEIGTAVSADFPDVLDSLAAHAAP
ncbi:MAG: hypothetical protein QOK35_3270 [Pseudonocardiales bacterium]|jgi:uncharacterized protein YndB with AHSA1/START domain|nr:hypothetical protein [Pseudonocardiales bacterium]